MHIAFRTTSDGATQRLGAAIADALAPGDVVLLSGDLGAGKTQLVKGLAEGLGVREPVTSPTFNILLVHEGRIPLYHMDLYRLERAEQLEDIDWWGIVEGDGVAAVEWGDRFPDELPESHVAVTLSILGDQEREVAAVGVGARGAELADAWRRAAAELDGVEVCR